MKRLKTPPTMTVLAPRPVEYATPEDPWPVSNWAQPPLDGERHYPWHSPLCLCPVCAPF